MSRRERDKGRKGEREVASLFEAAGLTVRGLEGAGDHLVVCDPSGHLVIHSEVKRQETARVWAWWEQALDEAPPGAIVAVTFRRSRSPWLSLLNTAMLAHLLTLAGGIRYGELIEAGNALADELDSCDPAEGDLSGGPALDAIRRWDSLAGGR